MFQFLKKTQSRNQNNQPTYPPSNQQFPGQFYNQSYNSFDINILTTELNELKRQINDLHHRLSRIESYLGIRETNPNHLDF